MFFFAIERCHYSFIGCFICRHTHYCRAHHYAFFTHFHTFLLHIFTLYATPRRYWCHFHDRRWRRCHNIIRAYYYDAIYDAMPYFYFVAALWLMVFGFRFHDGIITTTPPPPLFFPTRHHYHHFPPSATLLFTPLPLPYYMPFRHTFRCPLSHDMPLPRHTPAICLTLLNIIDFHGMRGERGIIQATYGSPIPHGVWRYSTTMRH